MRVENLMEATRRAAQDMSPAASRVLCLAVRARS